MTHDILKLTHDIGNLEIVYRFLYANSRFYEAHCLTHEDLLMFNDYKQRAKEILGMAGNHDMDEIVKGIAELIEHKKEILERYA